MTVEVIVVEPMVVDATVVEVMVMSTEVDMVGVEATVEEVMGVVAMVLVRMEKVMEEGRLADHGGYGDRTEEKVIEQREKEVTED